MQIQWHVTNVIKFEDPMIYCNAVVQLPPPWQPGTGLTFTLLSPVGFLVGPNGSGKSRFAEALARQLQHCRFLGTDRLRGMEKNQGMGFIGDHFAAGYQKSQFENIRRSSRFGFGLDAFVILSEKLDLRIRIEATLSHLFNRRILLEWDSGNLVPKAILGYAGSAYRLDSDECHGIKELLVLLTHLYDDGHKYLIIDEPELNLHPQFQAFFMQEVRKIAGDSAVEKKVLLLITHSPFILDFQNVDDLKSVLSFDLAHAPPRGMSDLSDAATRRVTPLVARLNVHHKQLFFSDNPIFVEGIFDAQIIQMIQECRGVSIAAAGSCVIDAGGSEEVNKYLELCSAFSKEAWFLYDLDSLFSGTLRACIRDDHTIADFLATLGLGTDFGRYCGALEQALTTAITQIRSQNPSSVSDLRTKLDQLAPDTQGDNWPKARVAVLVQLKRDRESLLRATSLQLVQDIEGRLNQIITALRQKNILLLPGGALENYLPSYTGSSFEVPNSAKRSAVESEIEILSQGLSDTEMENRYRDLYVAIKSLPAKDEVDFDKSLKEYLSKYINELQNQIVERPDINLEQISANVNLAIPGAERIFELRDYTHRTENKFSATILIKGSLGGNGRFVRVTEQTNAGMKGFVIERQPPA